MQNDPNSNPSGIFNFHDSKNKLNAKKHRGQAAAAREDKEEEKVDIDSL